MFQIQNIHKLSTREDPYNIHKILGIICVLNFMYRYTHFFLFGNMRLENEWGKRTLIIHGVLSCSSLFFTSNSVKPIIYQEFRMHSILFAMRSVIVCFLHYYKYHYVYIIGTCYSVLFLSDLITKIYNKENKNGTTTRNMKFGDNVTLEQLKHITNMYNITHIAETIFMLGNINTAFSPIMPIQISTFLMPLVKKGIITTNMLQFIYAITLFMNYFLIKTVSLEFIFIFGIIMKTHENIVFKYKINKYIAWFSHFTMFIIYRECGYEKSMQIIFMDYRYISWAFIYSYILYKLTLFEKELGMLLPEFVMRLED
jgi:hypothetical protein